MVEFNQAPIQEVNVEGKTIYMFTIEQKNIDLKTVSSFGEEWSKFNSFSDAEIKKAGDQYFDIVPGDIISGKAILDVGCGGGRWTKYLSGKAGVIECIDPSDAIYVAAGLLKDKNNIRISKAGVDNIPFPDNSFDLVFSLGVLHHIPDTFMAMQSCISKVKKGGYFLVYLYYSLDNRSSFFKGLFYLSNLLRKVVSRLPSVVKRAVCDILAVIIYMPFVLVARAFRLLGFKKAARLIPLSYYANKSFRMIRNDSLDRFGTPLEQRFSKDEIRRMMEKCGLENIVFSSNEPYWHAIGQKK